ncbi:hypothetical protein KI387_030570, partial [Taxus chinensis]
MQDFATTDHDCGRVQPEHQDQHQLFLFTGSPCSSCQHLALSGATDLLGYISSLPSCSTSPGTSSRHFPRRKVLAGHLDTTCRSMILRPTPTCTQRAGSRRMIALQVKQQNETTELLRDRRDSQIAGWRFPPQGGSGG